MKTVLKKIADKILLKLGYIPTTSINAVETGRVWQIAKEKNPLNDKKPYTFDLVIDIETPRASILKSFNYKG